MAPDSNRPRIFAVGGAHIDRRGKMTAEFVPGASIPGAMREDIGGGAFNALRAAVQQGVAATLMSMRGGDAAGVRVAEVIAAAGIKDASAVFLDRATPSYTALLDRDGDVVAALADMGLYDLAFAKQLRRAKVREEIARADAILVDANLPEAALVRLAGLCNDLPLFAIAISPAKAVRLAPILPHVACLFMNMREAAALAGTPPGTQPAAIIGELYRLGLRRGVVTGGAGPLVAFDSGRVLSVEPAAPRAIVDVTGAGDALAGATVAALLQGVAFADAIREGMAAAMLAVETRDTVPALTQAAFDAALALVPLTQPVA